MISTHDEAISVLRGALPGITDLRVFEFRHNPQTGRRSMDVAPHPHARGWSCKVPRLGRNGAVIAGSWVLPTTAAAIITDARTQVAKAIQLRDREMVHEQTEEQLAEAEVA